MTNPDTPRCPAVMALAARPVLAAVAAARLAGRPYPPTDWRCVRQAHSGPEPTPHLALPLGTTGPSIRFAGEQVDAPVCKCPDPEAHARLLTLTAGFEQPTVDGDEQPEPAEPRHADPEDVRRLIELVERPGTTAVRVNDGDELLLLMPETDDDNRIAAASQALADLFPTVTFLVLAGITGAVVMPRRKPEPPTYDELIARYDEQIAKRDSLILQGVDPAALLLPVRPLDPNA